MSTTAADAAPPLPATVRRTGSPMLGIGMTLLAIGLFAFMDTIGKSLMQHYPAPQVVWARYFFQCTLMLVMLPRLGVTGFLRTRRHGLQIGRGVLLLVATGCMYAAISVVPLADAYAITFTAPLLVTALSVPLLKERVGWRRWSAVVVGFVGVLIVIRPGFGEVPWQLLLPLVTAACFAVYQIFTRMISTDPAETPFVMLFYLAWVGALAMTLVVPFHWQPVAPLDWLWMAAIGGLGAAGHLILIRALVIAPASLIAPFTYSQIIWALILGYLVFGDLPDIWMLLGCTVIVASGLFVFYREAVLGKR
jgi:drug/metabolite transporter (DMT)-like permease